MKQKQFNIPESLLIKLYDVTGTNSGGNKGFILCHINSNGDPVIINRSETSCVGIALRASIQSWLEDN